jgi:hypothetical protein
MARVQPHRQRTNPDVVRAYARSEQGRAMIRRELVEGAQVRAGQQALLVCESAPPGGMDEIVRVVGEVLRELGAQVTTLAVDELIPVPPGSAPGAWLHVDQLALPRPLYEAIRAADVVLDYTVNSRGAQKYNVYFHNLSMYYGRTIFARRPVEAIELLSSDPAAPLATPEALTYPSDVLRVVGERVNDVLLPAAERQEEFRLTNPWGTDLRFTVLPGDVSHPAAGIREYPSRDPYGFAGDDNNRLIRALVGFGVMQRCAGVWVTRHCSLLGGTLDEPLTVRLEDGFVVGAEGPEAGRLMDLIADEPSGVHALLIGIHPKVWPFRDGEFLHDNLGAAAGVAHIALGGPGLFYRKGEWGTVGNKHWQLGNTPKTSLWAGATPVFEDGRLLALADPVVRAAAAQYGDPDELLRQPIWPDVRL